MLDKFRSVHRSSRNDLHYCTKCGELLSVKWKRTISYTAYSGEAIRRAKLVCKNHRKLFDGHTIKIVQYIIPAKEYRTK